MRTELGMQIVITEHIGLNRQLTKNGSEPAFEHDLRHLHFPPTQTRSIDPVQGEFRW